MVGDRKDVVELLMEYKSTLEMQDPNAPVVAGPSGAAPPPVPLLFGDALKQTLIDLEVELIQAFVGATDAHMAEWGLSGAKKPPLVRNHSGVFPLPFRIVDTDRRNRTTLLHTTVL